MSIQLTQPVTLTIRQQCQRTAIGLANYGASFGLPRYSFDLLDGPQLRSDAAGSFYCFDDIALWFLMQGHAKAVPFLHDDETIPCVTKIIFDRLAGEPMTLSGFIF